MIISTLPSSSSYSAKRRRSLVNLSCPWSIASYSSPVTPSIRRKLAQCTLDQLACHHHWRSAWTVRGSAQNIQSLPLAWVRAQRVLPVFGRLCWSWTHGSWGHSASDCFQDQISEKGDNAERKPLNPSNDPTHELLFVSLPKIWSKCVF